MKISIQKFKRKRESVLEVYLKHAPSTLSLFSLASNLESKKKKNLLKIKKFIQKLLNKQNVLEVCLRSTSCTPQAHYPYSHWFLIKKVIKKTFD